MRNKTGLAIAAVILALIALIGYSTFAGKRYRVHLCMAYQGRTACKTVSAHSEKAALENAVTGACAEIASGITDTMNCEQTDPKSTRWLEKPE